MNNIKPYENTIPLVSVIIINYNLAKEIEDCLDSLLTVMKSVNDIEYEVIIVDNDSPDRRIEKTEKKYKSDSISFYYSDKNLGFGKGCNFGFSKASGEFVLFLNPDTLIKENIFSPIINEFKQDESIGIIGPQQQLRKPFFDFSAGFFPNIFFELFNLVGLGIFLEGVIVHYYKKFSSQKILKVNWILGAAIFMKSKLFKTIDGFDKDYFMFFEELDLCKRVSDKNLKVCYYPSLKIHHIGSVSGKKDYRLYTIRTYASKYVFIKKNYSHFNKIFMSTLLFVQLISQIIIWSTLFPIKGDKSKQKIGAFVYLIKNGLKNKIDVIRVDSR